MVLVTIVVRGLPNDHHIQQSLDTGGPSSQRQYHIPTEEGWIDPRINGGQFLDVCSLSSLAQVRYKYLVPIVYNQDSRGALEYHYICTFRSFHFDGLWDPLLCQVSNTFLVYDVFLTLFTYRSLGYSEECLGLHDG